MVTKGYYGLKRQSEEKERGVMITRKEIENMVLPHMSRVIPPGYSSSSIDNAILDFAEQVLKGMHQDALKEGKTAAQADAYVRSFGQNRQFIDGCANYRDNWIGVNRPR